jgi:hypothetical protein
MPESLIITVIEWRIQLLLLFCVLYYSWLSLIGLIKINEARINKYEWNSKNSDSLFCALLYKRYTNTYVLSFFDVIP